MNTFGGSGPEPPYPGYSLPAIALQEAPMHPSQLDDAGLRAAPQGGRRKKKKQRGGGRGGRGGGRGGGGGSSSSSSSAAASAGPWPEDRQQATAANEENSSAARELEEQQQQQLTASLMSHILDQKKMELLKNPTIQRFIDLKQRQLKPL